MIPQRQVLCSFFCSNALAVFLLPNGSPDFLQVLCSICDRCLLPNQGALSYVNPISYSVLGTHAGGTNVDAFDGVHACALYCVEYYICNILRGSDFLILLLNTNISKRVSHYQ
jgi:hypothetical protein